jgi:fatty-acyl-CoA synthase
MYAASLSLAQFPPRLDESPLEISVGQLLCDAAMRWPQQPALTEVRFEGDIGRSWTFSQLLAEAERLARALAKRHAPGERVAVWAPNIPEWVLLELGAALAGLTLVTVNPSFTPREVSYVLRQSRASGLYHVRSHRGNDMAATARAVAAELDTLRVVVDLHDTAALYAGADAAVALPPVAATDPAQIQYTSGTTGFPKGAMLSHRNLINNARFYGQRFSLGAGNTFLVFMPMFHTGGCGLSVLGSIGQGARILLCPQFDAGLMVRLIAQERVTHFMGVPTMLVGMMEALAAQPQDMSSVRGVVAGGSMVAPELVRQARQAFGVGLQVVYGQTETSPVLTMTWHDDSEEDMARSVGQPLPCTEVAILDPRTAEVLPVGAVGEICGRGYMRMIGYNDNPEATASAIDTQGWLHTGDLGRMDERGYVAVTGRVKDIIIRGGENLYPAEIENAMLEHPELAEVAVLGMPDDKWGEIPVCFMRAAADQRPAREELVAFCRARLSAQKTPAQWYYLREWPLTGSGKIQKFELRRQLQEGLHRAI